MRPRVRYAATEARASFQEALDLARSLPPQEDAWRAQIEAVLRLASVAQNRTHYEQDLRNLEQVFSLAEAIGDHESLCRIQYWIGRISYVFGRFDHAVEFAGKALMIAEGLGGADKFTADPVNLMGRIHCLRGEARDAIHYSARNVEQMRRLGNRIEEAAMSGVLAFAYGMHGDFDKAFEAAAHGIELGRRIEHLPTQAACLFFSGVVRGWHGEVDAAAPEFEEALDLCRKSGDIFRQYLTHGWRGQGHLLAANQDAAEVDLKRCLELGDKIGTTFHRGAFQAFDAKLRLLQGEIGEALRQSSEALEIATETAQAWSRSIALRIHAEALLALEPPRVRAGRGRDPKRNRDPGAARVPVRSRLVTARAWLPVRREERARAGARGVLAGRPDVRKHGHRGGPALDRTVAGRAGHLAGRHLRRVTNRPDRAHCRGRPVVPSSLSDRIMECQATWDYWRTSERCAGSL